MKVFVNVLLLVGLALADRNNVCTKWLDYTVRDVSRNCYYDIDAKSDVPSIITRHGYKFEGLKAKTEDGYYLSVFRIPGNGIPVLLVHTYLWSSASFVSQIDKNNSLAFLLADQGYDVYLLNFRGTRYSLQHETYTPNDHKFWDYGIDEIARYDLEATFTLIEQVSGKPKLLYIGHKVGGSAFLAYGSLFPDKLKARVAGAALISPAAELRNSGTLLYRLIGRYPNAVWKSLQLSELDKLLSYPIYQKPIAQGIASSGCLMYWFVVARTIKYGRDKALTAQSTPYYLNAYLEGGSYKIALALTQYTARPFSMFDYGKSENLRRYGREDPIAYNYSTIQTPIYIIHSAADRYTRGKDINLLYSKLASEAKVLGKLEIDEKYVTNYDLLFGENAKKLAYEPLFEKFDTLKRYIQGASDGNNNNLQLGA